MTVLLEAGTASWRDLVPEEADALHDKLRPETPAHLRRLWIAIQNFDLSREIALMTARPSVYNPDGLDVEQMEREYRKYLFLRLAIRDRRLPMSKRVDPIWHVHVLNLPNYLRFTREVADGYFIVHVPSLDEEENWELMPDYLNHTLAYYEQYFGPPDPFFWPRSYQQGACCTC
jgi:hypothetical protein